MKPRCLIKWHIKNTRIDVVIKNSFVFCLSFTLLDTVMKASSPSDLIWALLKTSSKTVVKVSQIWTKEKVQREGPRGKAGSRLTLLRLLLYSGN